MRKIDTVLFDFDGTLMDTNQTIINSWQHAFRNIAGYEQDEDVLYATFGEPLKITMNKFFGVEGEKLEEYVEIYRSYQRENFAAEIDLFPGVMDMLRELRDAGYKLALVTSRLKPTTYVGVEKFDMEPLFDLIITADDCTKHKPDPEPINIALEKLGSTAEQAVMVGDTVMDIGCAANAGVKSVLVGWSVALPPEKAGTDSENTPDYYISGTDEMIKLLEEINRN